MAVPVGVEEGSLRYMQGTHVAMSCDATDASGSIRCWFISGVLVHINQETHAVLSQLPVP